MVQFSMMKQVMVMGLAGLFWMSVAAQTNPAISPLSFSVADLTAEKEVLLPAFDRELADKLDEEDAKTGELTKFARTIFTDVSLSNAGKWTILPDGSRCWKVRVTSAGAQALLPYFDMFYLPQGATLHIYSPDRREIVGAFTSRNNPESGLYAGGLIHGESFIMEYYEPKQAAGQGRLRLNEVGHAYRWVKDYFPVRNKEQNDTLGFNQSSGCEVNINCSEGTDWQNEKRAVVCIVVKSTFGQGICTGVLLNNARQDCTPYLLSAQHCSGGTNANHLNQWLFYFNYEAAQCATPSTIGTLGNSFIAGCSKKADSNDSGGDFGSDFILLQLNQNPPDEYQVYYAGWSSMNVASNSGVSIHHPQGDIKKVSTYSQTLITDSWGGSVSSTHWSVRWTSTANGFGVTESGSSGAPLFNEQKQVIGKLTGGASSCNFPNSRDMYGKLSFDWVSNGTATNRQLQPWLDPDSTGISFINGRNADCVTGMTTHKADSQKLLVFPNPASGMVTVRYSGEPIRQLFLYDLIGRVINTLTVENTSVSMNVSDLPKGVYLLVIESATDRMQHKLIVE